MVVIITFGQLFVDENYQPVGWKNIFKRQLYRHLLNNNQDKKISCVERINYIILQKENKISIVNKKTLDTLLITLALNEELRSNIIFNNNRQEIVFLTEKDKQYLLNTYSLQAKTLNKTILEENITLADIINFDENDNLYFYVKKNNLWSINKYKDFVVQPIITNISYSGNDLTKSVGIINNTIIYPECTTYCQFIFYNIIDQTKKNIDIATENQTENSAKDIKEVELLYFDESVGKIIYQLPQKQTAYITDFNGYLWHHIYLNPVADSKIRIDGILVDYQGRNKLIASSQQKKQTYIYDINNIGLKLIELGDQFTVVPDQVNTLGGCLLLKDQESKYWLKNIESLKNELLTDGENNFLKIW